MQVRKQFLPQKYTKTPATPQFRNKFFIKSSQNIDIKAFHKNLRLVSLL